jgi:cytochrome oxidase Cu insertion factor (SCO1/SenC/PrrC family)
MKNRGWCKGSRNHFLEYHFAGLSIAAFITGCAASHSITALPELGKFTAPSCCADPIHCARTPAAEIDKKPGSLRNDSHDQYTITPWVEPGERTRLIPGEILLTTQAGEKVKAHDLLGRPIALSFLYTRCDNPKKCPLIATTMASLQKELDETEISNRVQLLLVTYDPDYDSPAVLTKFGTTHGLRFERNALMLQPDSKQKDKLFKALNVGVNYNGQSVNLHSIQLMLLDSQGRYVRTYHSVIWNNQQVIEDLKRLLAETKRALIPGEVFFSAPQS